MTELMRGDIWLVDWSPGRGSEQSGLRPALVIQNNVGNRYSPTTIVTAISTTAKAYPFHVLILPHESGLDGPCSIKAEQIMTIDKKRLVRKLGQISEEKMLEVEKAIHISLGMDV